MMNIGVQTSEVALRNDLYRRAGIGFMMTPGAMELPDVCGLICAVQRFDDFNADNDPYGGRGIKAKLIRIKRSLI